jgi:hypothetical protein
VPGAPADILVLDTRHLARDRVVDARPDLLELVLARATKRDIQQLIVGGRTVVRDARCSSVDLPTLEAALTAEARASAQRHPADAAAIERLRGALRTHYACIDCTPNGATPALRSTGG